MIAHIKDSKPNTYDSTDLSLVDYVVEMNDKLAAECLARGFKPGSKNKIKNKKEFELLLEAIGSSPVQMFAGGSAANMLVTIKLLGKNLVNCRFKGIKDSSNESTLVQKRFTRTGVEFQDVPSPAGTEPEIATSICITFPDGRDRILITYAGNAKDILKPENYPAEETGDVVVLQGSVSAKFDEDRLARDERKLEHEVKEIKIFDTILKNRWDLGKWLILAYPTSAFRPEFFEKISKSADMILSNTTELGYVFKTGVREAEDIQEVFTKIVERKQNAGIIMQADIDLAKENKLPHVVAELKKIVDNNLGVIDELDLDICEQNRISAVVDAVTQLQGQQRESDEILEQLNKEMGEKGLKGRRHGKQIAMITDGRQGAYVVTSNEWFHVPAHDKKKIVNTLGAGDSSFAAFAFAIIELGFTPKASAEFAMAYAATKIAYDGPTLEGDVVAQLKEVNPKIAYKTQLALQKKQQANVMTVI